MGCKMDNKIKSQTNNWGGARAGAGRKKKEVKSKRKGKVVYFRILDDDYYILEKLAKENNLTVNKYSQNLVIEKIKENNR